MITTFAAGAAQISVESELTTVPIVCDPAFKACVSWPASIGKLIRVTPNEAVVPFTQLSARSGSMPAGSGCQPTGGVKGSAAAGSVAARVCIGAAKSSKSAVVECNHDRLIRRIAPPSVRCSVFRPRVAVFDLGVEEANPDERGSSQRTSLPRDSRFTIAELPVHENAFSATLSPRERRLAGRLEGFGDIVFGFAVSQCALQLPLKGGQVDLSRPLVLLLYFGTFAVLASLWLIYHRMLSGTYRPRGIDLVIPFAYLALVSLVPFALFSLSHNGTTLEGARAALLDYLLLYSGMTALATILTLRNLRRGYFYSNGEERDFAWTVFLRQAVLWVMMSSGLVLDIVAGPTQAGIFLLLIIPAIRIARWRFPHAPPAERLRLVAPAGG